MLVESGSDIILPDGQVTRSRVGLFECECGCGQEFFAHIKTRHPRYVNKTHRARAYRARSVARAEADRWTRYVGGNETHWHLSYRANLDAQLSRNRGKR
jgi:hypothetical protein